MIWFAFGAIQFWGAGSYKSVLLLISGIAATAQGIWFLTRVTSRTYLTLRNEMITVHLRKGFPGKKTIKYSDIGKGEVIGREIRLYLKNGRIFKLRNDWLLYADFSVLKKELEAHSISIR